MAKPTTPRNKKKTQGKTSDAPSTSKIRWLEALPPSYRWGLVVLTLLGLGAVGHWIIYPQIMGTRHWYLAQTAIDRYEWKEARAHLEECLKVYPNNGEVHFSMGRTCRRAGDFPAALAYLEAAEKFDWVPEIIELERTLIPVQIGRVKKNLNKVARYIETPNSQDKFVYEAMIQGALAINTLGDAFGWAEEWTQRYPEDWHPLYWHGLVLEHGLKNELAMEDYRKVLEKAPDLPLGHFRMAVVQMQQGKYKEAVPHFEKYLEFDPGNSFAQVGLARCKRSLGSTDLALATVQKVNEQYPKDFDGLLLRGQLELDRDNPADALLWLRKAERIQPMDLKICIALASAFRGLHQDQEAETYDQKSKKIEKDARRIDELVKKIANESPKDVELRWEVGKLLLELHEPEKATRWLISGLILSPAHKKSKDTLQECLNRITDPILRAYGQRVLDGSP